VADFITLSCPSCGHKLQINEDIDRFACAACGNEHIVNRSGGDVFLFFRRRNAGRRSGRRRRLEPLQRMSQRCPRISFSRLL
jgi:hypothetical protein